MKTLLSKNSVQLHKKNGYVFSITLFAISMITGLIVVFLFNTVNIETTMAGETMASRIAYWKALSRVSMLEQLIDDYGYDEISNGGLLSDVTFSDIDACNKRIISSIKISDLTRKIEGILHDNNCDPAGFPDFSMIFRVNQNWQSTRGHSMGWRHRQDDDHGSWDWIMGEDSNADIWGWSWDDHNGDDDQESESDDDHNNGNSGFGEFLITGMDGSFDGRIYIGANILIDENSPVIGGNSEYITHFMIPGNTQVAPPQPSVDNNYTWENISQLDLPDFDHSAYDSLLNIAASMDHEPDTGHYIGSIDWPYNFEYDETTVFHLHNYPDHTLFVQGDIRIKDAEILNLNGNTSTPGIIVATGDITVDSPIDNEVPDDIILISGGDVELSHTNFGSNPEPDQWSTVVNEIYARGQIEINGTNGGGHILAQMYVFGDGENHKSVDLKGTNFDGIIYAPNHKSYVELGNDVMIRGAIFINQVKNNKFQGNPVLLNHQFPSHFFHGGLYGLQAASQSWSLVNGSIREI